MTIAPPPILIAAGLMIFGTLQSLPEQLSISADGSKQWVLTITARDLVLHTYKQRYLPVTSNAAPDE